MHVNIVYGRIIRDFGSGSTLYPITLLYLRFITHVLVRLESPQSVSIKRSHFGTRSYTFKNLGWVDRYFKVFTSLKIWYLG